MRSFLDWKTCRRRSEYEADLAKVKADSSPTKTLHCPLCGQEFHVGDNVLAAYCNEGHAMAAYHQGLPAEDGKVYPIGWPAWFTTACQIVYSLIGPVVLKSARFREHYDTKRSPADAVWLEYGAHL